ncbi:MAG: hypothetical protein IJ814_00870 [Paludibacteraceae bacterium]|nr:hypothetical protein [Paludibacteraceae bacterium]
MKKLLTFCVVAMLSTLTFAGQKSVEVTSGSGTILKDATKKASFTFDYDSCYVGQISKGTLKDGAKPLAQILTERGEKGQEEWGQTQEFVYDRFFNYWNVVFRKWTTLVREEENPDYKIIFHVRGLDLGNGAASYFGYGKTGGVSVIGDIDVIAPTTGEKLTTYKVNQIKGEGELTEAFRLWSAYIQVVGQMCNVTRKAK